MNSKYFKCISIIGNLHHPKSLIICKKLYYLLNKKKYNIIFDKKIASKLNLKKIKIGDLNYIGKNSDLAIIVGGDGNIISAARVLSCYNIKIIGINLGNLGFLADLHPNNLKKDISSILDGKYIVENRSLLEVQIFKKSKLSIFGKAINEILLHSDQIANMIDFEVYIDKYFAFSQRSNGLIIATPTGSTAYCLSAGGPILQPALKAIILVSIFPHGLSFRPLVVNSKSVIQLCVSHKNNNPKITCDSQISFSIEKNDDIVIQEGKNQVNLIHPINYNYFNTLISKLGWSKKLF